VDALVGDVLDTAPCGFISFGDDGTIRAVNATLLGWLAAFLIVMGLFLTFGRFLGSQPVVVRSLIVSGVLAVLMLNVVMPIVMRLVRRGSPPGRTGGSPGPGP
jgi:chromate transport protein ChrA